MKTAQFFSGVFCILLFAGCELIDNVHINRSAISGRTITASATGTGKIYFSLATGRQITGPSEIASQQWDIGFQRTRTILTNSGVTAAALGSGGQGGVWYTDLAEPSMSDVTAITGAVGDYNTDVSKNVYSMSNNRPETLNVMNFPGYASGAGTQASPFAEMQYNKKQFYVRQNSSNYPETLYTYIVRHGDGTHYSRIRVIEYEYTGGASAKDTFVVEYENLN